MNAKVITKQGIESKELKLPEIFEFIPNLEVLKLSLRAYLANQRQSTAHTKTRGEVAGSTRKLYRQKGTGNARRGSLRSPLMRKGGIVFGPSNVANYKIKMNKKARKIAMKSAFAQMAKMENIYVLDIDNSEMKVTKDIAVLLKSAGLLAKKNLVVDVNGSNLSKLVSNIGRTKAEVLEVIHPYQIMNAGNLILTKSSLDKIQEVWAK